MQAQSSRKPAYRDLSKLRLQTWIVSLPGVNAVTQHTKFADFISMLC